MTHLYSTFKWAFDIKDSDIFFCTADIGWVTGHSYVVYAPLLHGATQVMYEGAPDFPDASRMWDILQKYKVTIFYTTPTALRMFMKFGDDIPNSFDLSSLRLLGTVGEPINPEVWKWYFKTIGKEKCPIIDTWWQTETGAICIANYPTMDIKPGSMGKPVPGVNVQVVDEKGDICAVDCIGSIAIELTEPLQPGMFEGYWQDDEATAMCFKNGWYYTGDNGSVDKDGYFWFVGRSDDMINSSGYRISPFEVESSLLEHPAVLESAVIGKLDEARGEVVKAFIILASNYQPSDELRRDIQAFMKKQTAPYKYPREIEFVESLPKTISGKIRRIELRQNS